MNFFFKKLINKKNKGTGNGMTGLVGGEGVT